MFRFASYHEAILESEKSDNVIGSEYYPPIFGSSSADLKYDMTSVGAVDWELIQK